MGNLETRTELDRHWEFTGKNTDRSHETYCDEVVVEFPQSGERISGKQNIYELRRHYPATLGFKILRTCGEGSLRVTEYIITYDESPVNVVCIMEFRDDKIAHETLYFGIPFEPPKCRSKWVERTD